jgi:hypothetical protein
MSFRRPDWTRPLPRPHTGIPFGVRAPQGPGIYLASAVFFNGPRLNAAAVAVCVAILFAIESPTPDISTVQPEETQRAQLEDTPSPAAPPDDPVSASSIDLVMGSHIQDASRMQREEALNAHDDAVSASSIDLVMGSPIQDASRMQTVKPSNAQREETPPPATPPDDPAGTSSSNAQLEDTPSPAAPPDDPVSTSSISYLGGIASRPLCVRRDALSAMLVEGMLGHNQAQATMIGCQTIAENAEVELLQRFPSGFPFLRIVKVKVTSSSQPEPLVGYTIEISR